MTHTYATLEVSAAAYDEIAAKLREAGYDHAFDKEEGAIDMHGIGLLRAPDRRKEQRRRTPFQLLAAGVDPTKAPTRRTVIRDRRKA